MSEIKVIKPFGPSIARAKMSNELIKTLNDYIDNILKDEKKLKELDHGSNLAGNVTEEFKLEREFISSSGYKKFLTDSVLNWLKISGLKEVDDFKINNCAGSLFHGIAFVVDYFDNNPHTFNLITLRSFGESFYHHITDASLEFGYLGL